VRHSEKARYDTVARALHWIAALLVIANLTSGLASNVIKPVFRDVVAVHKSIGVTIFVLSVARIVWTLVRGRRPRRNIARWESVASIANQWLFYAMLFVLPLTGWIFTSAGQYPLTWFGLLTVPKLDIQRGDVLVALARSSHEWIGICFAVLACLHVAAALRHHFILKDQVLSDMLGTDIGRAVQLFERDLTPNEVCQTSEKYQQSEGATE